VWVDRWSDRPSLVRFDVFMVMMIQGLVSWVVKMKVAWSSKTVVSYHIIIQCHNPKEHSLRQFFHHVDFI